jgi:peptidoglycan L-alanyl-D-glutamate endopeptidase CwlK
MFSSRKIDDLVTPVKIAALKFLGECRAQGIDVLVTCTLRDAQAQNELYAIGRTRAQLDAVGLTHLEPKAGRIVTNAVGGASFHQYRVALDFVPLRSGKPVWGVAGDGIDDDPSDDQTDDLELWQRCGAIAERCGFEWAGRWTRFREYPHIQMTFGMTLAEFRAGRTIPLEQQAA